MSEVYDEPIVVRLTQPVGPYPVGTEFGFKDVADAIRALGSSAFFTVVRTQDGDPIPPPTPEDLTEAERQALERARAARLIRGVEFDKLVPGPGEVIVGSEDGPVARDVNEIGGAPAFKVGMVVGAPESAPAITTIGAVRQVAGQHAGAWEIGGAATNALRDPFFTLTWSPQNATKTEEPGGIARVTVTNGGSTATILQQTYDAPDLLFAANDPVVATVRVKARSGVGVRIQVYSRTATGGTGSLIGQHVVTATGDWMDLVATGTYPTDNINGRASVSLSAFQGAESGEEVLWAEPMVQRGTAPTTFIPERDASGDLLPGYRNIGPDAAGPFARDAASLVIPAERPPHVFARWSEDGGSSWQQGVVAGATLGATGTITEDSGAVTISTTGASLRLEGLIGIDRPFTARERAALADGPVTVETLEMAHVFPPAPAPAQVTRAFHPNELIFRPVDVGSIYATPMHVSRAGDVLYLADQMKLVQSRDDLATTQEVLTAPWTIAAIKTLDDGELLFATHPREDQAIPSRIYKTTGYNPVTGTATGHDMVLEAGSLNGRFSNHWGLETCGNICVASQYGSKGEDGARYAYMSEDYGATWRMIFDQKDTTVSIPGAPVWSATRAHLHTIHYDRYQDRVWLACGDNPTTALYYSDDHGTTWTMVPGTTGDNAVQFTGIVSLPEGVVFGSDRAPNGVYAWRRESGSSPVTLSQVMSIDNETYLTRVFEHPFRRWEREGEMVLFTATRVAGVEGQYFPLIVGLTGLDHMEVLATLPGGIQGPSSTVGPTRGGYVYSRWQNSVRRAVAPFVSEM